MTNTMNATVVGLASGTLPGTVTDITAKLAAIGIVQTGTFNRPSARAELQGLPMFKGITGPMWNGNGARYETSAAYAQASL
jgi:hypothetical protein